MGRGYKNVKRQGKTISEHRLVTETSIGRKLSKHEHVHHKNGIRNDNRLENLEILSPSEHVRHHHCGRMLPEKTKRLLSMACRGERNWNARLDREKVVEIKKRLSLGIKGSRIAKDFSVGDKCISDIKLGKRWKHVL